MTSRDLPQLRPAVDADGPRLAQLIAACFAEYDGCVFDRREFPELAAIARHFAAAGGHIWVAEAAGALVASLGVRPAPGDGVELLKVYVARPWRGSGLAPTLLDAALAFARDRGATRLELWSDTRFTRAHAFYEKHGFRPTGERRFLADLSDSWERRFVRELVDGPER
ncbi:MAG: GNAT family N-acetyltransferase [Alphaproteobacteria bacterium]